MTKFIKLSATIALLWFVSAQATPLRAQQGQNYDFKVGKLYYKITDDANREVTVVSKPKTYQYYTDRPTGDVSIPAIVVKDGKAYRVTGIGDDAFCGYTTLNSITIPNSVTVIGEAAFAGCTGLASVALPIRFGSDRNECFRILHKPYLNRHTRRCDGDWPQSFRQLYKPFVCFSAQKLKPYGSKCF